MLDKQYTDEQIIKKLLEDYGKDIQEKDYKIKVWTRMINYLKRHKFASVKINSKYNISIRDDQFKYCHMNLIMVRDHIQTKKNL